MKIIFTILFSLVCFVTLAEAKDRVLFLDENEYKQLLADEELIRKKVEIAKKKEALEKQRASAKNKETAYHLFKEGRKLILESQASPFSTSFKKGLENLHAAIELDSTRAIYYAVLGDAYNVLATHDMPRATSISLNLYEKALSLDESLDMVRIKVAALCVRSGLYKESLDYFEKAIENTPMYLKPEILDWMNIAYIHVPQTQRGVVFYTDILEKYPQADILYIYKAILLKSSFRMKEAEDVIIELIARDNTTKKTIDLAYAFLKKLENNNAKN